MSALLVLGVSVLLLGCLGVAVMAGLELAAAKRRRQHVRAQALATEIELQRLTRQAMQRLLDEARQAQPGLWQ